MRAHRPHLWRAALLQPGGPRGSQVDPAVRAHRPLRRRDPARRRRQRVCRQPAAGKPERGPGQRRAAEDGQEGRRRAH
eukprot:365008-Chlamydomonas_euryale.AAC.3